MRTPKLDKQIYTAHTLDVKTYKCRLLNRHTLFLLSIPALTVPTCGPDVILYVRSHFNVTVTLISDQQNIFTWNLQRPHWTNPWFFLKYFKSAFFVPSCLAVPIKDMSFCSTENSNGMKLKNVNKHLQLSIPCTMNLICINRTNSYATKSQYIRFYIIPDMFRCGSTPPSVEPYDGVDPHRNRSGSM
jgi:hypothetical protein